MCEVSYHQPVPAACPTPTPLPQYNHLPQNNALLPLPLFAIAPGRFRLELVQAVLNSGWIAKKALAKALVIFLLLYFFTPRFSHQLYKFHRILSPCLNAIKAA